MKKCIGWFELNLHAHAILTCWAFIPLILCTVHSTKLSRIYPVQVLMVL